MTILRAFSFIRRPAASAGAVLLAAAILLTSAASSQIANGKSGSSTAYYFSGSEVWRSLDQYGRCYAYRNKAKAMLLLATEPGSPDEAKVCTSLFHAAEQSCLGLVSELRVGHEKVRGAIAEGLYKRAIAPAPSIMLSAYNPETPIRTISDFAHCYVATHGDRVRDLVTTTGIGSPQEKAAITAMAPDFGDCLPSGVSFEANATNIRFVLVEALYRALPPATAVAGKN